MYVAKHIHMCVSDIAVSDTVGIELLFLPLVQHSHSNITYLVQ